MPKTHLRKPLKRTHSPTYPNRDSSPSFQQACQLFGYCGTEGFFSLPAGRLDCDVCPVRTNCLQLWDSLITKGCSSSDATRFLNLVSQKLHELQAEKHKPASRRDEQCQKQDVPAVAVTFIAGH